MVLKNKMILLSLLSSMNSAFAAVKLADSHHHHHPNWHKANDWLKEDQQVLKSIAMVIPTRKIYREARDSDLFLSQSRTVEDRYRLCEDGPFKDEPSPAQCSAFLVGKNLVVTAGHCVSNDIDCLHTSFVFDLRENSGSESKQLSFKEEQVYKCRKIVKSTIDEDSGVDFSLIELDRAAEHLTPLRLSETMDPQYKDDLVVMGHPLGTGLRVVTDAKLVDPSDDKIFYMRLDGAGGLAGAPVYNRTKSRVEGVLVRGFSGLEFNEEGQCNLFRICRDDTCPREETVYASQFIPYLPAPNPVLSVVNQTATDMSDAQVDHIEPGQEVQLSFTLFNQGDEPLSNLSAEIVHAQPRNALLPIVSKVNLHGELHSGEVANVAGLRFTLKQDIACFGYLTYLVKFRWDGGQLIKKFNLSIGQEVFYSYQSPEVNQKIPNYKYPGLSLPIEVDRAPLGRQVYFFMDLNHEDTRQLRIEAYAPDGAKAMLYFRGYPDLATGNQLFPLNKYKSIYGVFGLNLPTYDKLKTFSDVTMSGKWTIMVSDLNRKGQGSVEKAGLYIKDHVCHQRR